MSLSFRSHKSREVSCETTSTNAIQLHEIIQITVYIKASLISFMRKIEWCDKWTSAWGCETVLPVIYYSSVIECCPKWYRKISLSEAAHKQVPALPSSWVTCSTLTGWENFAENGLTWDRDVEEKISGGNNGAAVRSDQPRIRQSWPAAKRMSWSWSTAMPYEDILSSDL